MNKLLKKLFADMNNFDFDFDFNDMLLGLMLVSIIILWMKSLYVLWECRFFAELF
jgi:hypothetical protein